MYQPAEQAAELQLIDAVGLVPSAWAVKPAPPLDSPALFCAVTEPLCVAAELLKL